MRVSYPRGLPRSVGWLKLNRGVLITSLGRPILGDGGVRYQ